MSRMQTVALFGGLALLIGCPSGSTESEPATRESAPAGPNGRAVAFIDSLSRADAGALAELTTPPLSEYFATLAERGRIRQATAAALRERFPDLDETDGRPLELLAHDWKAPMTALAKPALDGRLPEKQTATRRVYRFSFESPSTRRVTDELVIVRVGDTWKVESYGLATPRGAMIGHGKTMLSRLQRRQPRALELIDRKQPPDLKRALALYYEVMLTQNESE